MRARPETILIVVMSVFALTGLVAVALHEADTGSRAPPTLLDPIDVPPVTDSREARGWFEQVRHACNPLDVEELVRRQPPPDTDDGLTYLAACYALAGEIDRARATLEAIEG